MGNLEYACSIFVRVLRRHFPQAPRRGLPHRAHVGAGELGVPRLQPARAEVLPLRAGGVQLQNRHQLDDISGKVAGS